LRLGFLLKKELKPKVVLETERFFIENKRLNELSRLFSIQY